MAKGLRGKATPPEKRDEGDVATGYWDRSRYPLEILALILPLVGFYEIGLIWVLSTERGIITNRAHEGLLRLFEAFDIDARAFSMPALAMPALALVAVLVVQQFLSRRSWSVHLPTVGFMALESVVASLPLIVVGGVLARAMPLIAGDGYMQSLPIVGRIAVSVGAGLYEELVFRMILILFLHMLLVDVCRAPERLGTGIAIVISAALFALYHPLGGADGAFSPRRATFYFLAGIYFGLLYVLRGFGIAVGTHAAYDIIVVGWLGVD